MSRRRDLVATDLARKIWRQVGYCEHCMKDGSVVQLQGAHIYGVGAYPRLRDDLRNGMSLCSHCHRDFTDNPRKFSEWLKDTKYEKYMTPLAKKNMTFTKRFWDERIKELRSILKEIESGEITVDDAREMEDNH